MATTRNQSDRIDAWPRQRQNGWVLTSLTLNVLNQPLSLFGLPGHTSLYMPRAGSALSIGMHASVPLTSGSLTATLRRNGVDTPLRATLSVGGQVVVSPRGLGQVTWADGALLSVVVSAPGAVLPVNTVLQAWLDFVEIDTAS